LAGPALRVTVESFAPAGAGWAFASQVSSIALSLSVKRMSCACAVCDQPSGTLTEKRAPGGVYDT
jgi:hypothetical protein